MANQRLTARLQLTVRGKREATGLLSASNLVWLTPSTTTVSESHYTPEMKEEQLERTEEEVERFNGHAFASTLLQC